MIDGVFNQIRCGEGFYLLSVSGSQSVWLWQFGFIVFLVFGPAASRSRRSTWRVGSYDNKMVVARESFGGV